jgi:hypothetical protein
MTIDRIGLNLSALSDISAPNISINQTATGILNQLPVTANDSTGGFFAYIVLATIFIITYWYISDKSPLGDFRYSDIRALNLSLGITASIGLTLVTIGFIYSWMAVVLTFFAFLLSNVFLVFIDNRQ